MKKKQKTQISHIRNEKGYHPADTTTLSTWPATLHAHTWQLR